MGRVREIFYLHLGIKVCEKVHKKYFKKVLTNQNIRAIIYV